MSSSSTADIAAVGRSLATGRRVRAYRSCVVADGWREAVAQLRQLPEPVRGDTPPTVVFAFSGHGPAVVDGLRGLYAGEPIFREALDEHAEILAARIGRDIRSDLYGDPVAGADTFADLRRFQTAALAVELALCRLWSSWGVRPDVALGHSLGEVAAAACAGVFSYEDALGFIVQRSAVMYDTRRGANISVALPPSRLAELLPGGVTISATNGASLTTVTGRPDEVAVLAERLTADGVFFRYLNMNFSSHAPAMLQAAEKLRARTADLALSPPMIAMLSNVTGDWESGRLAAPDYWSEHLTSPVRFADQLERLKSLPDPLVITIATDQSLSRIMNHELAPEGCEVISPVAEGTGSGRDQHAMLLAAGRAWCHGAELNLERILPGSRDRAAIPFTVFDHAKRWPVLARVDTVRAGIARPARHEDPGAWLYEPESRQRLLSRTTPNRPQAQLAWAGTRDRLAESVARCANAAGRDLVSYQEAADQQDARPLDVLWRIDDVGPGLLAQAWQTADRLQASHPGSRVWMIAGPARPNPWKCRPRAWRWPWSG